MAAVGRSEHLNLRETCVLAGWLMSVYDSYSHYIAFMFLVTYVLKHKTSMSISIFECFLQYAKYLFHLLLVLS